MSASGHDALTKCFDLGKAKVRAGVERTSFAGFLTRDGKTNRGLSLASVIDNRNPFSTAFRGTSDSMAAEATPARDASGNLYGTTAADGSYNCVAVFKHTPWA